MKTKNTPPFKEEYSSPELYVLNWNYHESILESSPGSFYDQGNYGDGEENPWN